MNTHFQIHSVLVTVGTIQPGRQTLTTYHILSFHSSGVRKYSSLCLLISFLKSFLGYIIKHVKFFACN